MTERGNWQLPELIWQDATQPDNTARSTCSTWKPAFRCDIRSDYNYNLTHCAAQSTSMFWGPSADSGCFDSSLADAAAFSLVGSSFGGAGFGSFKTSSATLASSMFRFPSLHTTKLVSRKTSNLPASSGCP